MDAIPRNNLAARIEDAASRHPDRPAIIEGWGQAERCLTWARLASRIQGFSGGLAAQGVSRGDAVLLLVPPSIELYVGLLGCFHLGAVAVLIDTGAGRRRIDAAIARAAPRAVVAVPRAHLLRLVSPALRRVPVQIMAGGEWLPLERHDRPALAPPPADVGADELAVVSFGGGDGAFRPTARTHGFLMAQHEALNRELGVTADDVDLAGTPRFVLNDLAAGATAVLPAVDPRQPGETDPERIWEQIARYRVTVAGGPPAFFEALVHWCARHGRRLALRGIHTDGAPFAPTLARALADRVDGRVVVVYDAGDVEPVAAIDARAMLQAMVVRDGSGHPPDGVCVGRPADGLRIRLVHPQDGPLEIGEDGWATLEVGPGEVGEVVVSGHLVPGADAFDARTREATPTPHADGDGVAAAEPGSGTVEAGAETNGATEPPAVAPPEPDPRLIVDGDTIWRRTGDAGRFDAEGRLWIVGRIGRRVRREARTWWPIPAETRALKVAGVRHAAYLGLPDARYGQKAVLCVETDSVDLLPVEREKLRTALAPMPVDEVHALRRIPRDRRHEGRTDVDALARAITEIAVTR